MSRIREAIKALRGQPAAKPKAPPPDSPPFQDGLARIVVWCSLFFITLASCGIIVLVWTSLATDMKGDDKFEASKGILVIVLPVVSTWIGTILAFYYGRDAFKTAAEQARLNLGEKLSTPALAVAILAGDIKSFEVKDHDEALATTLAKLRTALDGIKPYFRLPLMTPAGVVIFIIHRQPLDSYLADQVSPMPPATPVANPTFKDLLDSPGGEQIRNALAFVPRNATLGEAKALMEANKHCQDVFITETGKPDGKVLGWLTNNNIQETATA